jgi:hypothetical protein
VNGDQYSLGQIPGQPRQPQFDLQGLRPPASAPPPLVGGYPAGDPTAPGVSTGEQMRGQYLAADEAQRLRQQQAAAYLQRVRGGQSAAFAGQQLGLGGLQQQQMAAAARSPLAQRAALYGQARASDEMLAQVAQRRAQEQQAALAMLQQTYGAEAAQRMTQAQQQLQSYGMGREMAVGRKQAAAEAAAAEQAMLERAIMASIGAAGGAMAASDRRLKRGIRRPPSAWEQELYQALRGDGR